MGLGKFFKKHWIKFLVGVIAASSLAYGVVSYVKKSDENELLRKAYIQQSDEIKINKIDVETFKEKYSILLKENSGLLKEKTGLLKENLEFSKENTKLLIEKTELLIKSTEEYNKLIKDNTKLHKENIELHKQSIEDSKNYRTLLKQYLDLLESSKTGTKIDDKALEELKKQYQELNKLYEQMIKAGKLKINPSIEKTKVVNKTDCSYLELICFRETSKKNEFDYSGQQGIYSKIFKEKGTKEEFQVNSNGIFITKDGFFLTNFHSYKDNFGKNAEREYEVYIPSSKKGALIKLNIISYSESSDLALFKINENIVKYFKEKFKFKNITLSKSTSNFIVKYLPTIPIWDGTFKHKMKEVKIKNVERKFGRYFFKSEDDVLKMFSDHYLETKDFVAKKGMSGAPLYDSSGNLAGVLHTKNSDSSRFVSSDVIFSFLQDCIYSQKNKK